MCLLNFSSFAEEDFPPPPPLNINASVSELKQIDVVDLYIDNNKLARDMGAEVGAGLSQYNLGSGSANEIQLGYAGIYVDYANFRPDNEPTHSRFNRRSSYGMGVAPIVSNSSWFEYLAIEGVAFYFMPKVGVRANHYYSNDSNKYSTVGMLSMGGKFGFLTS